MRFDQLFALLPSCVLIIGNFAHATLLEDERSMLDIFAKRQVDGSSTCTTSCSADRYGIEQLEICVANPYDRCICESLVGLTSECFWCLTGLNSVQDARKFQQDCGLYPKNPTIEQCTEACVKVGAHSARDQVNAFAACNIGSPSNQTDCYCEVYEIATSMKCFNCLFAAVNSTMVAAELADECSKRSFEAMRSSASPTRTSSSPTRAVTPAVPTLSVTFTSGALGSAYSSVVAAAASTSAKTSGSMAVSNSPEALMMFVFFGLIGGLYALLA